VDAANGGLKAQNGDLEENSEALEAEPEPWRAVYVKNGGLEAQNGSLEVL
jgi:hypothetical protein